MEKYNKSAKGRVIFKKNKPVSTIQTLPSEEVERVLEHVTSPYRWELLEVPLAQPKIPLLKKTATNKLRSKR